MIHFCLQNNGLIFVRKIQENWLKFVNKDFLQNSNEHVHSEAAHL